MFSLHYSFFRTILNLNHEQYVQDIDVRNTVQQHEAVPVEVQYMVEEISELVSLEVREQFCPVTSQHLLLFEGFIR